MLWILFDICYYANFVLVPIIIFVYFSRDDNFHSTGGLQYFIKLFFGRRAIKKQQKKQRDSKKFKNLDSIEEPKCILDEGQSDTLSFFAVDQKRNQLRIKFTLRANHIAEVSLCLRINGNIYVLPNENVETKEYPVWSKSIPKYTWKCQGLNIEILEPLKRCRLTFNGFLTNVSAKNYGVTNHVKFNFIWSCCSKPNFSWLDDDLNLLTRCLAKSKWGNGRWLDLLGDEEGYIQFGGLRGLASGTDFTEIELNMASAKRRFWGSLESETVTKNLTVFAATENGHLMHFGVKSIRNGCPELKFGHVHFYPGHVLPIQSSDLEVKIDQSISDEFTMHVEVGGKIMKLAVSIDKNSVVNFFNDNFHGFKCRNILAECNVNCNSGIAILDHWWSHKGNGIIRPVPLLREIRVENLPQVHVTPIGSEESKILELSGGKGCSLGLLKSLNNECVIPDGFIVTTYAFQQHADNNFHLKKAVSLLEDIAFGREHGNLEHACEVTVKLFEDQLMMSNLSQSILDELMRFRKNHNDEILPFLRWAVRSSAIGEDSEDFSSAGQNATFLGCQTDKDVLEKVTKCWASLYSYQSVIYRRQHGLPVRTSMGVVVQKIIPAESAGVLFTCHPSNSDISKMVITSNFGLGETVVSGEADPDTITLSRDFKGIVTFNSYNLGSKKHSIVVSKHGLHKNTANLNKSTRLSVSKEHAMSLGRIGVVLENAFGSPRDIEWAIFQNQIYVLQSRPVTTCNRWTDFELLHELDTPHVSNDIIYTKANVGEVSPFALTPLSQTVIMESIDKSCQLRMFGFFDHYVSKSIVISHHHAMLELLSCIYARPKKKVDISSKLVDLGIFGRVVLNDELNEKALARYGVASSLKNLMELSILLTCNGVLKKMLSEAETMDINIVQRDRPDEILKKIDEFSEYFMEVSQRHAMISSVSIVYQTFAMVCLMEGNEVITSEHYNDLALIVSCCEDVVSAEVPRILERIADTLRASKLADFVSLPPTHGVEWMKNNCPEAYELFQNFLKKHGHRLLGEMELSLNSWGMEPETVIKMIQANCKVTTKKLKEETQIDIVDRLVSPKKSLTRKILRFLIKKQRKAVGNREKSKSVLVQTANKLRIAYKILALEMTKTGLLPSPNLIYHLTHFEIWQILRRKDQNLISKAMRRQKLYPTWNKYKFPEIMYDLPVPEAENTKREISKSKIICKGTPVCAGEVTARACVITSLDEIHLLKEGDVLITRSTDIGWSPYFPILSGIVTELGGLISHGAVVAREYGLTCIVGAKRATSLFKTGDMVYLSGKDGILQLYQNNSLN